MKPPQMDRNLRVAMLGTYLPRKCGIATFSRDLSDALRAEGATVDMIAVSDRAGYDYPPEVVKEIRQDALEDYVALADWLNESAYDVLHVQHEFGIFGGEAGSHVTALMQRLRLPVVTTLHTVLLEPTPEQQRASDGVAAFSQRLIVMSETARRILQRHRRARPEKVAVVPHGIPDLPQEEPEGIKQEYGLAGRPVVLTFGLLSPGKGIETVIRGLPDVPGAVYVVAGQTHPHVQHVAGESYRESLATLAKELGVADRVRFIDRFVEDRELRRLLRMADVYVTPYLSEAQVTSGTLAVSVGNGKATVSTPYWHAQELLADGRGVLVPFRDPAATGRAIAGLIADPGQRRAIEARAYAYGRAMRWPTVAKAHVSLYAEACRPAWAVPAKAVVRPQPETGEPGLPPVRLDHVTALTDEVGMLQHARYTVPNRFEGYCLDDNARALLMTVALEPLVDDGALLKRLQSTYLAFCVHALDGDSGRFRNFMAYDRRWLEPFGSEDAHGRALWCLGHAAARASDPGVRELARELCTTAEPAVFGFTSPRAWAYSGLGFLSTGRSGPAREMAARLVALFRRCAEPDWVWFEPVAAYANARLPEFLIRLGHELRDGEALDAGLRALRWLTKAQSRDGVFCPIGNAGFYPRGGDPALFDQQPIEAAAQVSACLAAHAATGDEEWAEEARKAFDWFTGDNLLWTPIADVGSGGCRDGLGPDGPNENQGAESTLSYVTSLAAMLAEAKRPVVRKIA